MLIFIARYSLIFWIYIFSSKEQNLKLDMEREQPNFYPISACTAKCMQAEHHLQQQQQPMHQLQEENSVLFQKCFDSCKETSNQLVKDVRKIHDNLILKLICRDDKSLTFRIDMEGTTATTETSSSQVPSYTSSMPVYAGAKGNHATVNASAKWTKGEIITPGSSSKNNRNVYVVTIHEAKDTVVYDVYLSDENFFIIDDLKQNTTYNITCVAVNANSEYSIIAKGQQYTTLRRGYTPGKVQDIRVQYFQQDEMNDMRVTAKITWKPSADMTCHYNIICFSPESEEYGLTPLEIRNSRQLYSYNIENLAFSLVYKIGIRAINPNNISKESDLFWETFNAPSCEEWYNYNFNVCAPLQPEGLVIDQFVEGKDIFSFNISWQQPAHYPDYYTLRILDLSLENASSYIMNISKHQNSIFVSKIKLIGMMYEVHLTAYTPGGNSSVVVNDFIRTQPSASESPHIAKLIAAVLAPIFCIAILSLTTFIICHRRAKLKRYQERCKYFEELEKKAPIDPKANFDFPTKNLSPLLTSPEQFQLEMFFYNDAMEIDRNDLTLHEVLGEGAFGLVRRGVYQDNKLGATREVAVKMLKDNPSADDVRAFRREIEVMKSVEKHPNIVGIIGHCTKLCNEMLLLTEYCSFGNLLNFLRNEWKYLHELSFQIDGTITMLVQHQQQPLQQQQQQQQRQKEQKQQHLGKNENEKFNSSSNHNPFNLDVTIIEKIKQKYSCKYFNTTRTTATKESTTTTASQATLLYTKKDQQDTLLSGNKNQMITTILTGKDMQHIEEVLNTCTTTTTTTKQTAITPTTVDTPPPPSPPPPPFTPDTSSAAAENKSYGYDEICTNACKCQVDVLVIKDIDPALGQSETEQLERALQTKCVNNSHTHTSSKIKIKNCDCSKVLAKNNKNNAKLQGSSRCVVNKGYYKYLRAKGGGGSTSIKNPESMKCNKENSKSVADDNPTDYDDLHSNYAAEHARAGTRTIRDQNEMLIGSVKREPLTALDLLDIAKQVAVGMEFLAKNKVVHRDLAARNVLVSPDRTIKIADFGLSRDIYQENMYKKTGNGKLPIKWLALESMTHQVYTTQSDVWSYGILLYEIVTLGSIPYPSIPTNRLLRLLKSGYRMEKPKNCGQEFYDLMYSCWNVNPAERPNFTQIVRDLDELMLESPQRQIENLVLPKIERPEEAANSDDSYLKPL